MTRRTAVRGRPELPEEYRTRFIPGQRLHTAALGEGYRRYTVVRVGRTYLTLLDVSSVAATDVPRDTLETSRDVRIVESNPTVVLRILAGRIQERAALGMRMSGEVAIQALTLLEEMLTLTP